MTLKSALQDVKETTLAAVSGLLGKLAYLASLRRAQDRPPRLSISRSESIDGSVSYVNCTRVVSLGPGESV